MFFDVRDENFGDHNFSYSLRMAEYTYLVQERRKNPDLKSLTYYRVDQSKINLSI